MEAPATSFTVVMVGMDLEGAMVLDPFARHYQLPFPMLVADRFIRNGQSAWTASPVRPDMRPLNGVLLAVHAFVPVAVLHARLAERGHPLAQAPRFAERRREVRAGNEQGLAVLREKAEPTPAGERLLAALEAVHASAG